MNGGAWESQVNRKIGRDFLIEPLLNNPENLKHSLCWWGLCNRNFFINNPLTHCMKRIFQWWKFKILMSVIPYGWQISLTTPILFILYPYKTWNYIIGRWLQITHSLMARRTLMMMPKFARGNMKVNVKSTHLGRPLIIKGIILLAMRVYMSPNDFNKNEQWVTKPCFVIGGQTTHWENFDSCWL